MKKIIEGIWRGTLTLIPLFLVIYVFVWVTPESVVSYEAAVFWGGLLSSLTSISVGFLWLTSIIKWVTEEDGGSK